MSWSLRKSFELLNGLIVPKKSSWRHACNFGSISIIPGDQEVIELIHEHIINAWKVVLSSNFEGKLLSVLDVLAVLNQMGKESVLIDHSSEESSVLVQSKDSVIGQILGDDEDRVVGNSGLEDLLARRQLIDVDKAELSHDVEHPELFGKDY